MHLSVRDYGLVTASMRITSRSLVRGIKVPSNVTDKVGKIALLSRVSNLLNELSDTRSVATIKGFS